MSEEYPEHLTKRAIHWIRVIDRILRNFLYKRKHERLQQIKDRILETGKVSQTQIKRINQLRYGENMRDEPKFYETKKVD